MGTGERGRRVRQTLAVALGVLVIATFTTLGDLGDPVCYEDFNDPGSGWDTGMGDTGLAYYRNGAFQIRMTHDDAILWSWSSCTSIPDTFVLEATGHTRPGIRNAAWGVIWGIDDENFLAFLITPFGEMTVLSMRNGKWQPDIIPWKKSPAIDQGDGVPNTLRVTVYEDLVDVAINKVRVGRFEIGEADDLAYGLLEGAESSGPGPVSLEVGSGWSVGIAAGSFKETPVELDYVELAVYSLP